jgi:pSer/pThr/pTyr-binding forkhead associated (FHA) protein
MAVLSYLGPEGAAAFELGGVCVTIGRKKGNDLAVDWDPAVSGRHAELEQIRDSWFVTDLMSLNGTWVNGERIDGKKALHVNDEIRVGDTVLMFCGVVSSEPYDTTAPAAKKPDLTRKQVEVLRHLCRPQAIDTRAPCSTTKEIAGRMYVGEAAVKAHLATLYEKFEIPEAGQQRRALLAKRAWETGAVKKVDFEGEAGAGT